MIKISNSGKIISIYFNLVEYLKSIQKFDRYDDHFVHNGLCIWFETKQKRQKEYRWKLTKVLKIVFWKYLFVFINLQGSFV